MKWDMIIVFIGVSTATVLFGSAVYIGIREYIRFRQGL